MRNATMELPIRGMICNSCVAEVEEIFIHSPGVIDAKVSYLKSRANLTYDPELMDQASLEKHLKDHGYETGKRSFGDIALDVGCIISTALLVWFLMVNPMNFMPKMTSTVSYGYLFLVGLLTSPHCIGMCGGILLSQTGAQRQKSPSQQWGACLAYQGGRVASYTAMGAICGALGTALSYTVQMKSMVFTLLGLLVLWLGLSYWGMLPGPGAIFPEQRSACELPGRAKRRYDGRPLVIGILTGIMPCGALYTMWMYSVSLGSARAGMCSMLAFALGTVPLLFLFGSLGSVFPQRMNRYVRKASAVLITAMGCKMLLKGILMCMV